MTSKSLTIFLLGFATLCCLLQGTNAQDCTFRLFPNDNDLSYHIAYDENNNAAPFTGLVWNGNQQTETQGTYPSLRAVEGVGSTCGKCHILGYSTPTFSGQREAFMFAMQLRFFFPFDVQSLTLHCLPDDEEQEEFVEEYEGNNYDEILEWILIDSTEANSVQINKIRNAAINQAISELQYLFRMPQGQYQIATIHNSWIAALPASGYKFDVDVSNGLGSQYKLMLYLPYNLETDEWFFYQYNYYRLN